MQGKEGLCVEYVQKLLRCVAGAKYANISSCKEEMRALRKCCEDNNVRDFSVHRDNARRDEIQRQKTEDAVGQSNEKKMDTMEEASSSSSSSSP